MISVREALQEAQAKLSDSPSLESEILLAYVLEKPRDVLYTWPEKLLSREEFDQFSCYVERRLNKEPIAYIVGIREFWSLPLSVSRSTLIPRPETETLVELVLDQFDPNTNIKIADLGTGCGAIALAIASERPNWTVHATDISESALYMAQKNANDLSLENIIFSRGDWCAALSCFDFDVIVSNPPYIAESEWLVYEEGLRFEPRDALVSGQTGLDALSELSYSIKNYLKPLGYVFVEHGFSQGNAVRDLFKGAGYKEVSSVKDLNGLERVTKGQYYP